MHAAMLLAAVQAAPVGTPAAAPLTAESQTPAPPPPAPQEPDDVVVTGEKRPAPPGDPLEKVNAKSFAASQAVDTAVVAPVSRAYKKAIPEPARNGLRNALSNIREPIVFINFLLQLKPGKAAATFGRFGINSTIGVFGLFDFARRKPFNLPRRRNGFANTLGYYGVKPGPFLFMPMIGPTTLRDMIGGGVDGLLLPVGVGKPFNQTSYTIPTRLATAMNRRNEVDERLTAVRATTDPYASARETYLSQRQIEIDALHGQDAGAIGTLQGEPPASSLPVMPAPDEAR